MGFVLIAGSAVEKPTESNAPHIPKNIEPPTGLGRLPMQTENAHLPDGGVRRTRQWLGCGGSSILPFTMRFAVANWYMATPVTFAANLVVPYCIIQTMSTR